MIAHKIDTIRMLAADYGSDVLLAAVAYRSAESAKDMIGDMSCDPEWMGENIVNRKFFKSQVSAMIEVLPDTISESQGDKYCIAGSTANITNTLIELSNELIDLCPELRKVTISL